MRDTNLGAHPAPCRSGERVGPSSRHPGVRCPRSPLRSALSHREVPPSSISRLPDVELRLISHPEGHVLPCLPSAQCWFQPGLAEREQPQSPDVSSQRRFPAEQPLSFPTASFPIHRFSSRSSPCSPSPAPRRKCGYGPGRGPGEGKEPWPRHRQSLPPWNDAGTSLLSHSPSFPAPTGIFSPRSSGFWHPPCPDRWRRGTAGVSTRAGLPGAGAFLPTALRAHSGHRHLAGAGGESRGPLAAGGPRDAAGSCRFPA